MMHFETPSDLYAYLSGRTLDQWENIAEAEAEYDDAESATFGPEYDVEREDRRYVSESDIAPESP